MNLVTASHLIHTDSLYIIMKESKIHKNDNEFPQEHCSCAILNGSIELTLMYSNVQCHAGIVWRQ